ncbi:MAG TPA: cell wall hydrolase [Allosphingosinicella sp.]|jgi:spore germination cell wall hydrolase CwlJ-like protein|nr:cell wall hydrolase [Allosphingosinicella sp.]
MIRFFRAASLAAAAFVFVFGAPSLAWELTETPLTTALIDPGAAIAPSASPIGAPPPAAAAPAAALPAPAETVERPAHRSLAELVAEHASAETADAQQECLAGAVYFEAKGEPLHGQLSVAEVILNRARSGRFPASACGVVKQRGQFSFIRGGRFPAIARASLAWKRAVAIAHIAVQDLADGPAPKALFFHAKRVSPRWRLTRVAAVGNHIFYR